MNTSNKQYSFDDLPQMIAEIHHMLSSVQEQLNDLKTNFQPKEPIELMTRNETAEFFKCDLSTIHYWTKKGKITKHCIGNRVYYKRPEIESCLVRI
jgi:hypothetical protein